MQVPPDERILNEERLNDLASAFADCIKELYADKLPTAKFTLYMKTPKSDDQGNESIAFMYSVSDDSVDGETLDTHINSLSQPLNECFLDKMSPSKDRDPGRNWVGYYGQVLSLKGELTSKGNKSIGDMSLDESQWIKMIEFAQEKNWYSKFEIIGGAVIGAIIEMPIQEIWELLKARLSEGIENGDDQLTDLIEKIKDLPIEEFFEEIKKHLGDFIL